jgi:hypothetical protein
MRLLSIVSLAPRFSFGCGDPGTFFLEPLLKPVKSHYHDKNIDEKPRLVKMGIK